MINPEMAVRIAAFLAVLVFIFYIYWLLSKRIVKSLRRPLHPFALSAVSAVLAILTVFFLLSIYVYHGFGYQPDIYRIGSRNSNMVALTFDDGPSEEFTPAILDILQTYDVPATFFMVGSHVEKYPEIARRVTELGHAVGNHTQNHRNIPTLSTFDLHQEIIEATTVITEITGVYPVFVRPPRGIYDGRYRRLSKLLGQEIVLWSISTRDWRYGTKAEQIVRLIRSKVQGGDIILFHDSGALLRNEGGDRRATVESLPAVIEAIREKGLKIVPLEKLLEDAPPEISPEVDCPE